MESHINILLPLLIILLTGLLLSEFFKHMKLPFASAIILAGALLGPHGLDYINHHEVITFFGFLGSAFLMFMAGLETDLPELKKRRASIALLTAINGLIPIAVGIAIARYFEYSWQTSLLMGTIFLSSSVAIVFSVLRSMKVKKEISQIILSTAIFEDILSLMLFAVLSQSVDPQTPFPLPIYFTILIISIVCLQYLIPHLARYVINTRGFLSVLAKKDEHEDRLRFTIIVLIAVLLYFSILGVHPILAAFFVGLLLSQENTGENIYKKFHSLSYGLFVPVFFFIIGMELDIGILSGANATYPLLISIVAGLIASKYISGFIGGRLIGFNNRDATIMGVVTTTQLTTTLAVAYAAFSIGLLDQALLTSCIVLAVVTNIFVPLSMRILGR